MTYQFDTELVVVGPGHLERGLAERVLHGGQVGRRPQQQLHALRLVELGTQVQHRAAVPRPLVQAASGRERNVLFNDALNTFYLWLYGVRHMVKDHSDSEKGNPLLPHRLLFLISSKGSFICIIPQTG